MSKMDELFKALSEMIRIRILSLLLQGEMCVCEIECSLKLTQSNASRHMSVLKRAGIVERFKQAQWTYYQISESFKAEHSELWEYLALRLKMLPTYQSDSEAYAQCKANKPCYNIEKSH